MTDKNNQILFIATKVTEARFVEVALRNEIRFKDGSTTDEEFRATLTVVVEQDAYEIQDMEDIGPVIVEANSISGSFNGTDPADIVALVQSGVTYPFQLVDQQYRQLEANGSLFFRGVNTWVSAVPFSDITWT